MAEAFNSIFKAELVRNKVPWHRVGDVEIAVAEYIDWYTTDACTASSAASRRRSTRSSTTTRPHPPRPRGGDHSLHQTRYLTIRAVVGGLHLPVHAILARLSEANSHAQGPERERCCRHE
jgi:hypothetical protein